MTKSKTNKDGSPDKRFDQHDKPYCGTKPPSGAETASFGMKARDGFASDEDYKEFLKFFRYKAKHFKEELSSNSKLTDWAVEHCKELARGNFYTALADNFGKPYLEHTTKCNNAWYYHNDAALIQRVAKGIREKRILAAICEARDWNASHAKKINEEAHDKLDRWFTWAYIQNICESRKAPNFPSDMAYELDYGTQSKYTIETDDWAESGKPTHVEMTLKIGDAEKNIPLKFSYDIPERILMQPYTLLSMRKPCFYMDDDNGELMVTIPYWFIPPDLELGDGALGSDAGIVRIMKCGMVYENGSYIENIAMSPEIERKNAHIAVLMFNKEHLYTKKERIARLIKHHSDSDSDKIVKLKKKLANLEEQYSWVRSNIASEREALCWLVARDLCVLVRQYGGNRVRVEDLRWVGGSGQSWNFSQQRQCLEIVAKRYGIGVESVSAANSSKSDPSKEALKLMEEPSTDSRTCVWADETEHDRDDTSGLELGCREPGKTTHDRDAVENVEVEGEPREYAPEIVAVKPRGRKAKKTRKTRREAGRSEKLDYSYRPDIASFHSSIRERRQELAHARESGGESFNWFDFVVGSSRSVALLRECRSVDFVPAGSISGGVPAHPTGAIQSSTDNLAANIIKRR